MRQLTNKAVAVPVTVCNCCGKEIKYERDECVVINLQKMTHIPEPKNYYDNHIGADREDLCKPCGTALYEKLKVIVQAYRTKYKHPYIPKDPKEGIKL